MEITDKKLVHIQKALDRIYDPPLLINLIKNDPVEFPHLYQDPGDIEISGFIASALAFGRIGLFKPVIKKILSLSDGSLSDYITNFDPQKDLKYFEGLYYRMCKGVDIVCLVYILREVLRKYGSIHNLFYCCFDEHSQARCLTYRQIDRSAGLPDNNQINRSGWKPDQRMTGVSSNENIREILKRFVEKLREIDTTPVYGDNVHPRGLLQLLPSPTNGGPCKRLNMYLRWMVRQDDGIDFGLWDRISPSILIIPLDTHIIRICKNLNMTTKKSPTWIMAEEITENFRVLSPEDPLKYDFALCHLGVSGKWKEVLTDGA